MVPLFKVCETILFDFCITGDPVIFSKQLSLASVFAGYPTRNNAQAFAGSYNNDMCANN